MTKFSQEDLNEIRASYRQAANKDRQIQILADPHTTDRESICAALGLPLPQKPPKKKKSRSCDQSVKDEIVKAVLLDKLSQAQAAEKYGVPGPTIAHWVQKAKQTQKEFLDYPEQKTKPEKMKAGAGQDLERRFRKTREGVKSLYQFVDAFGEIDIFGGDEHETLNHVLYVASGFTESLQKAIELMKGADRNA